MTAPKVGGSGAESHAGSLGREASTAAACSDAAGEVNNGEGSLALRRGSGARRRGRRQGASGDDWERRDPWDLFHRDAYA